MRLFYYFSNLLILGVLLLSVNACKKEAVPKPSDFNKSQREILGDRIRDVYLDSTNYILDHTEYSETYNFLNKIYKQAANKLLIDQGAPEYDKWTFARKWKVFIINDASNEICFVIPGGDLFVSTSFLRTLENENELYYLLSFEANIINENYLLNRLFSEYGTVELKNIINEESSTLSLNTIAYEIQSLEFSEEQISTLDLMTLDHICNTSLYKNDGLEGFINLITMGNQWINTRPSYTNRMLMIDDYINNSTLNCGTIVTTGLYETSVLEKLQ